MIRSLDQMVEKVLSLHKKHRIAVAWAHDIHTVSAIYKAVNYGLADATMIGQSSEIKGICRKAGIDHELFRIVDSDDEVAASLEAVRLNRSGEADIAMKGLVSTDKFLKAVMDKNKGLMLPKAVLSYVCAIELPAYHKLLFITDPAVIPEPSLEQKIVMAEYGANPAILPLSLRLFRAPPGPRSSRSWLSGRACLSRQTPGSPCRHHPGSVPSPPA